MRLSRDDLRHISAAVHQGKNLLFGVDADRAIYYAVKLDPPRVVEDVMSHWGEWQLLPLPHDAVDPSVAASERAAGLEGLLTANYATFKDSAAAPVQAVSDGDHLVLFRQSVRGTLLVDRFVLDAEVGRLHRTLEVRFKRSRQRDAPSQASGGQDYDSRDFRDTSGAFFHEPSLELHLIAGVEEGRFSVAMVPTHEHDAALFHVFSWDRASSRLRVTSLRRTAAGRFDLRDYSIVDGDGDVRSVRKAAGILRREIALQDAQGAALAAVGPLGAVVYESQRAIEGEDGELHLVKVARRVMVTATTADAGKIAAISYTVAGDGTLASLDPAPSLRRLRERREDLRVPSSILYVLEALGGEAPEAAPEPGRVGVEVTEETCGVGSRRPIKIGGGAFTLECWARRPAAGRDGVILGQGEAKRGRGLHLGFSGDRLRFGFHDDDLVATAAEDHGAWHHYACVAEASGARRIYRDGALVGEDRSATTYEGEGPLSIGRSPWGLAFTGEVSDVRVWRRARSEAELRGGMHRKVSGNEAGLVSQWGLDAIVDGVVTNAVARAPEVVVDGARLSAASVSRTLADGVTPALGYRHPMRLAIAERSTYIEHLELRGDAEIGAFDFVFWGETVAGESTTPVRVPATLEPGADGWIRASATFTAGVGMTRLRALEISAPAGAWTRLELRDHRIERVCDTISEELRGEVATLTELVAEQGEVDVMRSELERLEGLRYPLVRRLAAIDRALAGEPSAQAADVAALRQEVAALAAEVSARASERALYDGGLHYGGALALRANNGVNDRYLSVSDTHVDATRDDAGPWETFALVDASSPSSQGVVRYGDWIALRAHTGKYVIADNPSWPANHYYWVTAVYPEIGAYERWQILHPDDPAARGPVPRGGPVSLRTWRDDQGSKYMMTGTAGLWWQKTWAEHSTAVRDARYVAVHRGDSPAAVYARERHEEASRRHSARVVALELAERFASAEAAEARERLIAERARIADMLARRDASIAASIEPHMAALRRVDVAPRTMPRLSPPTEERTVDGALLGFARAGGRLSPNQSLQGAVLLHFPAADGGLRRAVFDAVGERWLADVPGACARFEGAGAITIPHIPELSPTSYTVEMWFRWDGEGDTVHFLCGKGYEELEIHTRRGGLRFIPAPRIYVDTDDGALTPGEWVHLACVFAGTPGSAEIYINGAPRARARAGEGGERGAPDRPLVVGARFGGSYPLCGQIAEFRVWGLPLGRDEILAQMHHPLVGDEHGLVGYWPFDELDGAVARDRSPGRRDAVLAGPRFYPSTSSMGRPLSGAVPCLTFEGIGEVTVPYRPDYARGAFTLEAWIRWDGGRDEINFIVGRGLAEMEIHTGGSVPGGIRFIPVPGLYIDTPDDALKPGVWTHVACIYNGNPGAATVFLDGATMVRARTGDVGATAPSTMPLVIGSRRGGDFRFRGAIAEVRLWGVARSLVDIQATMRAPLSGSEVDLLGYWPLREGVGEVARDHSPAGNHGRIAGPRFDYLTGHRRPVIGGSPPEVVLAGEYASVDTSGGQRRALLRRFLAWPARGGVEAVMDARIDEAELCWVGNAQMNPTLVGYIEGAPPVPSENLTIEESYDGISSVEFKIAEETTTTFTHDLAAGTSASIEGGFGLGLVGEVGVAFIGKAGLEIEVTAQKRGKLDVQTSFLNQHSRSGTATMTTSEALTLKGEREEVPRFPELGRRFIPKNVGYATVVSTLADIFVVRLRRSKRMISYQIAPVRDVPPDVNTVTFLINPAYTMNGSLDGQVGTHAADDRFYGHVPAGRATYGSALPASYYRLREAYALKDAIDRSNRSAEAIAINLSSDLLDGIDRPTLAAEPSRSDEEAAKAGAQSGGRQVVAAADSAMAKKPVSERIAQVIDETPKGNIVNTYVWDGDGGLRVQTQTFATSWSNVFGGSLNAEVGLGLHLAFKAVVAADVTMMFGAHLTETLTNASSTSRAIELNVNLECERRGITDNRDRPLVPGEKVDRYRFMSFALQPATDHFRDFFDRVVDPEWLESADEEARVLRQIDQSRPNKTWRVLHRVTYVERPIAGG